MMRESEVKELIKRVMPDAEIEVTDTTGGSDHFQILVISNEFKGKLLIDQHRMVQKSLEVAFSDGRIHAVQIKTETPESWAKKEKPSGNDFQILN